MTQAPAVATKLGRYELRERLGQGGMASVYAAVDTTLGRDVAIKVMHPFIAEKSEASARFEREARAVAKLRHPNILRVHDYAAASAEHAAYLVMERLSGPSLARLLADRGAPPPEVAAMIALRVAQALAAAHAEGIVHRDVKPANVMFDRERVVLCDFGLARIVTGDGMTASGTVLGSPAYMSPEQASSGSCDARSDQFSWAVLTYELATGVLPFWAPTPLGMMARIARGEYFAAAERNPKVPPYLAAVIGRCLRVDPAQRFAAVDECVSALTEGLAGDGLGDVDAELAAYVREPAGYVAALEERVVAAAWAQVERARARGDDRAARAARRRLAAWRPQDARLRGLATTRRRRRALSGGAAVLALAGVVAFTLAHRSRVHREPAATPSAPAVAVAANVATAPRAVAPPAPSPPSSPPAAAPSARAQTRADAPPPIRTPHHPAARPAPPSSSPAPRVPPPTPAKEPAPVAAPASEGTSAPAAVAARPADARLTVATKPACDLRVDGAARGRTPQTLTLAPGRHHLDCAATATTRALAVDVDLAPGATRTLRQVLFMPVRILPFFSERYAFSVDDDKPVVGVPEVVPGRHRITLFRDGAAVSSAWVDVPPDGCRLVDQPQPACVAP